ncbi:MAG: hypothetical protein ACLTDF_08865 [Coprococcus sp.]
MDRDKKDRTYIAIDLKSFFASVECVECGLDPLTKSGSGRSSRTEKTIFAVSPSASYGIPEGQTVEVVRGYEANASGNTFTRETSGEK